MLDLPPILTRFEQKLAANPQDAQAHFDYGCTLLLAGDYVRGWQEYQWRAKFSPIDAIYASAACPVWTGQSLEGKSIVVWGEQGVGDKFQFVRYLPLLKQMGALCVTYSCQEELHSLFARCVPIDVFVGLGEMPTPDFHCPLLGLPAAFGTTLESIPAATAYLFCAAAKQQYWQSQLINAGVMSDGKKCVGLVWRGNMQRGLSLADLLAHLPPEHHYICLQKDITEHEQSLLRSSKLSVLALDTAIQSWEDTAALCANLDLVVSVDTSVAHLAAAMARPTWILLPSFVDWRWLLNRTGSPWYPTAYLWRQEANEPWPNLVSRMCAALKYWQ